MSDKDKKPKPRTIINDTSHEVRGTSHVVKQTDNKTKPKEKK